jgi:hypothetical protein
VPAAGLPGRAAVPLGAGGEHHTPTHRIASQDPLWRCHGVRSDASAGQASPKQVAGSRARVCACAAVICRTWCSGWSSRVVWVVARLRQSLICHLADKCCWRHVSMRAHFARTGQPAGLSDVHTDPADQSSGSGQCLQCFPMSGSIVHRRNYQRNYQIQLKARAGASARQLRTCMTLVGVARCPGAPAHAKSAAIRRDLRLQPCQKSLN